MLVVKITDFGIGIRAREHDFIYNPDFVTQCRVSRVMNQYGSHLSLWMSQRIITDIGGTISIDSKLGEGSTFTVAIPYKTKGTVRKFFENVNKFIVDKSEI